MTTQPGHTEPGHPELDRLARQATADPPTRIPSLADLRRRAAQRRRRRNLARLAALPTLTLAAIGAWAITQTDHDPTQLTAAGPAHVSPTDSEAPPGDTEPPAALPGPFVWPAPPRGYDTLDELVEQFAVEVLGSPPDTDFEGAIDEAVRQSLLIYPEFNPETSGAFHGHELFAVAEPSGDGWGFILIGAREISLEETAEGGVAVEFVPPGDTASNSVEVRYTDGQITSATTAGTELLLPEGRRPESVASVIIRHLDENGKLNTVTGLGSGDRGLGDFADFPLVLEPPEEEPVPDLVGLTVNAVLDLLDERELSGGGELRVGHLVVDEDATEPPGTVIATGPHSNGIVLTVAGGMPSQSPEDAARDQIVPELAALPAGVRVRQADDWAGPTHIETAEGVWMISRMDSDIAFAIAPGCGLGDLENPDSVNGRDVICTLEYAEIVLLDPDGEILRAYPFPGVIPRQLHATDDSLYCIGQGDGGLPDSVLCRIDLASLEPTVRVFPSDLSFNPDYWSWLPAGWTLDEPVDVVLWSQMAIDDDGITISGHGGTADIDPHTLELLSVTETPSE